MEVFSNLDSINEKAIELEEAKKNGTTTSSWISDQLEKINSGEDEASEKFMNEINSSLKNREIV